MPYPNEHACRLADPGQFSRFDRDNEKDPNVIIGFRADGTSEPQSFRYPTDNWTAERARAHCGEHDGTFEQAAAEEQPAGAAKRAERYKALSARFKSATAGFHAVITTDSIDDDGEVLVPDGMNSQIFDRIGLVLWNHDTNRPIGKAVGKLKRTPNAIEADANYLSRPSDYQGDWFPDFVKALVEQDAIRGVSVRFRPLDGGMRSATKSDRSRYGAGVRTVYNKWELLEYSVTPFQANPNAVITAVRKGLLTPERAQEWFGVEAALAARRRRLIVVV